ncbi:MAG: PfkB family carbohydrate kinase, partial [Candidatus Omnitrophota bacterium]|nr:PfkB family carbohydrate kinase [Candidatus Omnitrophota bacterium]
WANKRTFVPGGTANVANNISSFGAKVSLLGVTGDDGNSKILLNELKKRKISSEGIFVENNRHTTVKTRILAGHQQVVRVDWEHTHDLSKELNTKILKYIEKNIKSFDAVIIEDYGKGVINVALLKELISLSKINKKIITVDPKEENFRYYHGVTAITPNRKELENAIRNLKVQDAANRFRINTDKLFTDKDVDIAASEILEYLNLDSILITLGEQGMKLLEKNGHLTHIPTQAQEVFDVSGAGDTVISTFTLALSAGASKLEAAHIANFAAGIVVGKLGTAVTNQEELLERIK